MKTRHLITAMTLCTLMILPNLSLAQSQVELNSKFDCEVDTEGDKNTTLVNSKTLKEISISKILQRIKRKIKSKNISNSKRKKQRALLRLIKQCKNQKGDFNPEDLPPTKTGSAFAKANLITTGTSIAAKCSLVIPDSGDSQFRAVTGGSIYCSLGAVVTAGSGAFFLFGNTTTLSQALTNITFIPNNGQFNNFSVDLDAETAQLAVEYLRTPKRSLSGQLSYTSSNQTFDHTGNFEETSGEGDCQLQASLLGQGNSGQVFLDLADGSISVMLGNEVSSLTFLNIFAGNDTNSPTVGQFSIPQSIIDVLPQDSFSFNLDFDQLAQVVNAVANVSETLTVSIPQSPVDNTLVGTFTAPQTDCPAAQ